MKVGISRSTKNCVLVVNSIPVNIALLYNSILHCGNQRFNSGNPKTNNCS
jgi:hypothetical protein